MDAEGAEREGEPTRPMGQQLLSPFVLCGSPVEYSHLGWCRAQGAVQARIGTPFGRTTLAPNPCPPHTPRRSCLQPATRHTRGLGAARSRAGTACAHLASAPGGNAFGEQTVAKNRLQSVLHRHYTLACHRRASSSPRRTVPGGWPWSYRRWNAYASVRIWRRWRTQPSSWT